MPAKLTTEEFIEKARSIHGDFYDYSKVEYVNNYTKVTITCSIHGEFQQKPVYHLGGSGCYECGIYIRKNKQTFNGSNFTKKAKEVYGDKYDYSKVEYVNNKTKIIITCPIHGDFEQIPSRHLLGKGCPQCYYTTRRFTTNEFIEKAKEVHGDKYDYSKVEYVNNKSKVIITCPEHGDFEQTPIHHLKGHGCIECTSRKKLDKDIFISKAKEVHGDKYDYSKVEYTNNKTSVTLICPEHGKFEQKPNNHLIGKGCYICANERKGFWNPEYIKKHHKDKLNEQCTLYVLECYSNDEMFIKVGITTRTLEERYHHESLLNGYQYNTLYEYHSTLIHCSITEQEVLKQFKDYQYTPKSKFEGSSECIDINQKDVILKTIKESDHNVHIS